MPRPGPRRTALAVKVNADALTEIDRLAAGQGISRSAWVRGAIHDALIAGQRGKQPAEIIAP